nr:hypothetical protein [uncultured Campylobacter sp.]
MKKIIVLTFAIAAFLGAKEPKSGEFFLENAKSAANLRAFLKANQDEIVKLNLSYCANENSLEILKDKENERIPGVNFSRILEEYKPSKELTVEHYARHFDLGEGYDGEINAGVEDGELIIKRSLRDGAFESVALQVGGSDRGKKYMWRYLWDEKARCKGGEVRLDGIFYVNKGEYPAGSDLGDDYDIFWLDPIAKKYFKLLEYKK